MSKVNNMFIQTLGSVMIVISWSYKSRWKVVILKGRQRKEERGGREKKGVEIVEQRKGKGKRREKM